MTLWLRLRVRVDRLIALVLLVLLAPLVGVVAIWVRRDGGPAFVGVPRVGIRGETFRMWKLRTMHADGAGGLASGGTLALGDTDPRITSLGRRLRHWRIDELPNLLNVVQGRMALIGPRPEAPDHVDDDDPRWDAVLRMPPGLIGPTQVLVEAWEAEILSASGSTGYDELVLPVKLAIDGWYVDRASPTVDLLVVRVMVAWLGRSRGPRGRLHCMISKDIGVVLPLS